MNLINSAKTQSMKLTILGSGTCVPSINRASPATHLKIQDTNILIDCGPGTLRQMEQAELSYQDLDLVCLTHFHTDHISDLNALIFALNNTPGFSRKKELQLVGPVGLKQFLDEVYHLEQPYPNTFQVRVKEIKRKLQFDDFVLIADHTGHSAESLAYRFQAGKNSVTLTGDTDLDERVVKLACGTNLLLAECSFANEEKRTGHLTPAECGQIALRSGAKQLILTHLYPSQDNGQTRLKQAKRVFNNTLLAEDLMEVKV